MGKLGVGLHLYTVREDLKADYRGTLMRAAALGYPAVSGYGDLGGMSPVQFKAFMADTGLIPVAGAVEFDAAIKDPASALAPHAMVGAMSACVMWLGEEHRKTADDVARTAERFNTIGKAARKLGLVFQYHNHDFEFGLVDGVTIMDRLVEATDPALVGFQVDTGWVVRAGQDPAAWLRKLKGRVPTIHLKDTSGGDSPKWVEVGNGVLDLAAVHAASLEAGVRWWLVEQDECVRPPMESAGLSLRNASMVAGRG